MLSIHCCAVFALNLPARNDLPVLAVSSGVCCLPWNVLVIKFQQVVPSCHPWWLSLPMRTTLLDNKVGDILYFFIVNKSNVQIQTNNECIQLTCTVCIQSLISLCHRALLLFKNTNTTLTRTPNVYLSTAENSENKCTLFCCLIKTSVKMF